MTTQDKQKILNQNFLESESRYQNASESRDLHLREFWKETTEKYADLLASLSSEELRSRYVAEEKYIGKLDPAFSSFRKKISFAREITSFLELRSLFSRVIPEFTEKNTLLSPSIAFWKENTDSSETYEGFKHLFKTTAPVYVKHFGDVCEAIAIGTSDFGIIPIENSIDGKLFGFYRMLERGDLMICATCDIENTEKDIHTKYALIAKKAYYFDEVSPVCLELSFYAMDSAHLFELIHILEALNIEVSQINSLPPHYQTTGNRIYITLSVSTATLPIFLCYLWLFETDYSVLGLFIHIEKD